MAVDYEILTIEDDVLTVAIQGEGRTYMLWQRELSGNPGGQDVYFEYDDQINGGYQNVEHCRVSSGGIDILLVTGERVYLRFPEAFDKLDALKRGLYRIYEGSEEVLSLKT